MDWELLMTGWNEGYTTDTQYTSFFHGEIMPAHLAFAATVNGYRAPDVSKPFTYCELGSGQGVTLTLAAAVHPESRFWGFDFNPGQIANSRRLAEEANVQNVVFEDWSFAQALDRVDDLPKFDFITLHGIYSWVSDENRAEISRFIDKALKPGGLVYVSYNAMPGWAQVAPFRHLARQHYLRHPGRSDLHVPKFLEFNDTLDAAGSVYHKVNTALAPRVNALRTQPAVYFAHEFLNSNWKPMYVNEVAAELGVARVDYMASATLIENIDVAALPPGLAALLGDVAPQDRIWQELARDFANNKAFRRDIYVRGANTLSMGAQDAVLRSWRYALAVQKNDVKLSFKGPIGEVGGSAQIYDPIIERLSASDATYDDLLALNPAIDRPKLVQALTFLVHSKQVVVLHGKGDTKHARHLNSAFAGAFADGLNYAVLASAGARTGILASGHDMLVADAVISNQAKAVEDAAKFAYQRLAVRGRGFQKDGVPLSDASQAIPYLVEQFTPIMAKKLPIWKDIGVV